MTKDLNNDVDQHRPDFNSKSKLARLHTEKLLECAIPLEVHCQLEMASVGDGILKISYLNEDGTETLTRDGKPFVRERLSESERERRWTFYKRDNHNAKRPGKYSSPSKNGCRLYHPPLLVRQENYKDNLADINKEIRFTEGEFKTISANLHDPKVITIGLGGVNGWRDRYDGQGKDEPSKPIVELDELPLKDRRVRLCFDSDHHKPQVRAALKDFAHYLNKRGAIVLIEVLPSLPEQDSNGDWIRLGVDDLIYRCGAEAFQQIKKIAQPAFKGKKGKEEFSPEFEPKNTHRRNVCLKALVGPEWRASTERRDSWTRWTGTHWESTSGNDAILRVMEQFMEANGWQDREERTFRSLMAAFRRSIEHCLADPVSGLVACRNGCLRLSDRKLIPHDSNHGNSYCLPFNYDPSADHNPITGVLAEMITPLELNIFRAGLHSIVTGRGRKAFIEITGPGNSGKSVFSRLAIALAGVENTAASDLEKIENRTNRFETLKLRGKRLAVFNECDRYSGSLNVLKAMTGGDRITAEKKNVSEPVDFCFEGLALLVGNSPVDHSDQTGAVINRRRSIVVPGVISSASERELIETEGTGWRGEFVEHLPGLMNWALEMSDTEAKDALAKDTNSLERIQRELDQLFQTDKLAEWAEDQLIYDPNHSFTQVGNPSEIYLKQKKPINKWKNLLMPNYEEHVRHPLGLDKFKRKLIDMLRDTYGLPLPKGSLRNKPYRNRDVGSVVPHVRLRSDQDGELPGILTQAAMLRLEPSRDGNPVTDPPMRDGQIPVGERRDGCDGLLEIDVYEKKREERNIPIQQSEKKTETRHASHRSGSTRHAPVTPCHAPSRPTNTSADALDPGGQITKTSQALQGHDETFWQLVEEHPNLLPSQIANKFNASTNVVISNNIANQLVSKSGIKR